MADRMSIDEIDAAFGSTMLKVLDTNKVGEKVRKYLYDLDSLSLADTAF